MFGLEGHRVRIQGAFASFLKCRGPITVPRNATITLNWPPAAFPPRHFASDIRLIKNPSWTPRLANWGRLWSIFTDAEEATITGLTCENSVIVHRLFTDEGFITVAVNCLFMKCADDHTLRLSIVHGDLPRS
jgi:hypothetical protein